MFKKIVLIFFKTIISLIFILIIAYYNGILIALKTNSSIQFVLCQFLSFLLVIFFIFYPFIDKKIFNRAFCILFFIWLFSMRFFPDIQNSFTKDSCLDIGICKEGLEINSKYGLIQINEENCLKYNWKWKDGYCSVND